MLNMLPPAAAGAAAAPNPGEVAPKLAGAAPKFVLGAPNAGAGLAGAPNGFALGAAAAGAAPPKLNTPVEF